MTEAREVWYDPARMRIRTILIIALASAGLAACGGKKSGGTTTDNGGGGGSAAADTLYARLGGAPAVAAVVDDFVANVAADTRINAQFVNANIPNLKKQLNDQICNATGGGCPYTGKDMKTAHKGMKITDKNFDDLVEDLVKSLDKFKVIEADKQELLKALGGLKGDIVGQ